MKYTIKILAALHLLLSAAGCTKFVDVDPPPTSLSEDIVFTQDATAVAVLTEVYATKMGDINANLYSLTQFAGLSADELQPHSSVTDARFLSHYHNALSPIQSGMENYWMNAYNNIFIANTVIEKLTGNELLTPTVRDQLLGEAKFLRAFMYFTLVNLFGDVPLNLTIDYRENRVRARSDKTEVIQQVLADLADAKALMAPEFKDALMKTSSERSRPNKFTASALLARVYLYEKDYAKAEAEATEIISNMGLYSLVGIDEVFLKNSQETIWSLQPLMPDGLGANTPDGNLFILSSTNSPANARVSLTGSLANAFSSADKRKNWVGIFTDTVTGEHFAYAFKYKAGTVPSTSITEYSVVFRLAEQYLIRAEARGMQGKFDDAASDINVIRSRAGLNPVNITDENNLITTILNERRLELFTEWGHRWFDLVRLDKATEILQPIKGSDWQDTDELYPIPQVEMDGNPGIKGDQNPGY